MTDICRWNFQMYFNDENVLSVIDIQLKFVYGIHFNISLSWISQSLGAKSTITQYNDMHMRH